jgi:hypothetical protein
LVLDAGEVKEMGTHDELIAKQGHYYQLHKLQFEKQEKTASSLPFSEGEGTRRRRNSKKLAN